MLSMIAAVDANFGIGYENDLPWNFPEDMAYFKEITLGHDVIMGANTYFSIGRALPKRKNYVISKETKEKFPAEITLIENPIAFFEKAKQKTGEIFIIGGASIYELALPYVNKIYLTHIQKSYQVDTFFPKLPEEFKQISSTWSEDKMLNFVIYEHQL